MKTQKNILVAFVLNLAFAVFEFVGGALTGSVAVLSDALHDLGDAASIGVSYVLERKSMRRPDGRHTYGYLRYSVLGSVITTAVLLVGSLLVIYHAVRRIIDPVPIHYDGMILMAVLGVCVNAAAAWFTREGDSLNQKAVNLHMLEDVLGWAVVLVGAVVMRFTDLTVIDPLMSIGVAVFILLHSVKNLGAAVSLFLEKTPEGIDVSEIRQHLLELEDVADAHHIHIWSMDGQHHYATMHIVTDGDGEAVKRRVREELAEHGITHATLELERVGEVCEAAECRVEPIQHHHGHHHH